MTHDWHLPILNDALSDKKLELIIFPTEQCNFRCSYCYEDFAFGKMSHNVVEAIKRLIEVRADDLVDLHLSWFGGEPLLAYDIVLDINHHAQSFAARRDAGSPLNLHIGMTTNGYLLDAKKLMRLHASGVRHYQISLDGLSAHHDATRKRIDGRGTFDNVWRNLRTFNAMRAEGQLEDASIMLRLHVHPKNLASMFDLAEQISEFLCPEWFSILIKNIGHYGGENDQNFEILDPASDAFQNGRRGLNDILRAFRPPPSAAPMIPVCYAAKANAFTIRADGHIGKCTVALNSQSNVVGVLNEDGRMTLDPAAAANWLYALQSMSAKDLGCPIGNLPRR